MYGTFEIRINHTWLTTGSCGNIGSGHMCDSELLISEVISVLKDSVVNT